MSFKENFIRWWKNDYSNTCPSVGGQAVMEGVMMKGPKCTAITVRKADGKMTYITKPNRTVGEKHKWLKIPIVRGVANFAVMLADGIKTLTDSADMAGLDLEEPTAFEKKMAKVFKCKPDDVMMASAVILAVVLAIGLFVALPYLCMWLLRKVMTDPWLSIVYGLIRICLFLGYVYLCSRLKEIKRVFMYHGAEHKSIFCFEHGDELTVENARKYTRFHPRCGTSFLMIVMIISLIIAVFLNSVLPKSITGNFLLGFLVKLLMVLPVAGISYEILKWLGRAKDTPIIKILKWPGLMTQRLTTAEPDDSMLEVALVSLKASLGWEKPLPESYYDEETAEPENQEDTGDGE
jgi:Predicted metal-dependent enzyme